MDVGDLSRLPRVVLDTDPAVSEGNSARKAEGPGGDQFGTTTEKPPELGAKPVELTHPGSLIGIRCQRITVDQAVERLASQPPRDVVPLLDPTVLEDRAVLHRLYEANFRVSTALYEANPSIIGTDEKLLDLVDASQGLIWQTLKSREPERATVELGARAFERHSEVSTYFDRSFASEPRVAEVAIRHLDVRLRYVDAALLTRPPFEDQIVEAISNGAVWEGVLPTDASCHPRFAGPIAAKKWDGFGAIVARSEDPLAVALEGLKQSPLVWMELPLALRLQVGAAHPELEQAYQSLVGELHELGLEYLPSRVGAIATIRELIHNRRHPDESDGRKRAVVVYPTSDWNKAFESNDLEPLTQAHRVLYYEATSNRGFVDHLQEATRAQPADLLVVGGHGTQTSTRLGAPTWIPPLLWRRRRILSLKDEPLIRDAGLGSALVPGAKVVLESCSTGKGKGEGDNMANMFARLFPEVSVYAPTAPTSPRLDFDEAHQVVGVVWSADVEGYVAAPTS